MNKHLKIREIKPSDEKELFDLLNNIDKETKTFFHPHSFDINTVKKICKNNKDHYFIMKLNKELIGYSFLRLFGYNIPSFGIIIKKKYTGRGYGTYLTKWIVKKAKELGYDKVILKTYKKNIAAQKVYDKIGFRIVGETDDKKEYKLELEL